MSDEKSLLETTLNTRDLGRYQSTVSGNQLKTWHILRSDVQNYPSVNDISLLKKHRILTVLDLRGTNDVKRKPSGFVNQDGFLYINIPIDEGSGIPESTNVVSESYLKIAESTNMPCVFQADIIRDYMLTKTYNRERFELIHHNFPEIDMNIVIPSERYMKEFLKMLIAKYGSFRDYLTAIGIKKEEIDNIAVKLL